MLGTRAGRLRAGPSRVLTTELEVRQKREQIPAGTLVLAVEDPETRVGSGGATLNALLVAAEHLSARAGFTVSAHLVPLVPERICVGVSPQARGCRPWAPSAQASASRALALLTGGHI